MQEPAVKVKISDQDRNNLHYEMLSVVSHDLKSPLVSIIGSLEIYKNMAEKLATEKKDKLINIALHESYRLESFINNIMDMAKLERGFTPANRNFDEDMKILIEECLHKLDYVLGECKVTVHGDNFTARTDKSLLQKALCIVLDNAAKYANETCNIVILYKKNAENVQIVVTDNGPGIPEGKLTDIFDKYTCFSDIESKRKGLGLGLPICKEIMHLLDGGVTVANIPGGGAEFTLQFAV